MQFLPGDLAQLQVDDEANRRRQAQAQALQQAGFNPVQGGNSLLSLLTSVMSTVQGGRMMSEADAKASEIMAKRFEIENQQAQAKAEAEAAKDERNWQRDLQKIDYTNRSQAQYAAPRNIDPLSPEGIAAALGLEKGKKALPPQGGGKQSLEEQMWGMLSPEQRQAAAQAKFQQTGTAPSGYRPTANGALEAIPGGPADKPKEADPKAAAAAQVRNLLGQLKANKTAGGPLDQYWPGENQAKFQGTVSQLANPFQALTKIPGSGANSDFDAELLQASLPNIGDRESVTAQKIENLESYLSLLEQGKGLGEGSPLNAAQPAAPQTPAAGQPTQTATNPQTGQKIGLINGQWVPL